METGFILGYSLSLRRFKVSVPSLGFEVLPFFMDFLQSRLLGSFLDFLFAQDHWVFLFLSSLVSLRRLFGFLFSLGFFSLDLFWFFLFLSLDFWAILPFSIKFLPFCLSLDFGFLYSGSFSL